MRDNPALIAVVGPAVVANGAVDLPKAVQEKIADLNRQLAGCSGRPPPDPARLPTDPDGTLAKACPAEMAAIDDYAASRELNAAGVVRFLTADALERCGRLGRPAEGTPPPPDGATAVTPPAELRCRRGGDRPPAAVLGGEWASTPIRKGSACHTTYNASTVTGEDPRRDPALVAALRRIAPGTELRHGIDDIIKGHLGALIVIGEASELQFLFSGGLQLDHPFSAQFLSSCAKMDGAIILNASATPHRSRPTSS